MPFIDVTAFVFLLVAVLYGTYIYMVCCRMHLAFVFCIHRTFPGGVAAYAIVGVETPFVS